MKGRVRPKSTKDGIFTPRQAAKAALMAKLRKMAKKEKKSG